MKLKNKFLVIYFIIFSNISHASENFFHEAKKLFEDKKIENSKFLFQRNLVFNPKHAESYLYLAKIYEIEKNEKCDRTAQIINRGFVFKKSFSTQKCVIVCIY